MPLSLGETQVINQLADRLYPFLPGKPHPYADPRISFRGIARDLKLGRLWMDGSKLPAITELLGRTFAANKARFATVMLEAVRRGLVYREGKDPIKREDIEAINELLLKLHLRVKELNDPRFLDTLPSRSRRSTGPRTPLRPDEDSALGKDVLKALQRSLAQITSLEPVPRGFAFERFLNELFHSFDLAPKGSFRLVGEQIDGSFLDGALTYLVEAKWQGTKVGQSELLAFYGKVAGKAQWSRGAHISLSGYSDAGLEAFARGKQTNIICFDGLDIHYVLQGYVSFRNLIQMKTRCAAESNAAFASVRSLLPHLP